MLCEICRIKEAGYTMPMLEQNKSWRVYKVCAECIPDEMIDYVMNIKEDERR